MKKLIFLLAIPFLFLGGLVHAENSAASYDRFYWSGQVFVQAYNNGASSIAVNNAVVIDSSVAVAKIGSGSANLGQYITTSATTDSVYIFGVTDEAIAAGALGRVCVRGPHKVVWTGVGGPAAGTVFSNASTTAGLVGGTSTAAGTNHGILGRILSATVTTDTGDAANTYWAWIQPQVEN
jgi:hypothetical protein